MKQTGPAVNSWLAAFAIVVIAALEAFALARGVQGADALLSVIIGLIAGIAGYSVQRKAD